ncbi:MAG: DNA topoisomerase 4 subunit A [Clostridia bacterium]|nr:DNA topoisomerase 4 subunit A [Clostridia bacterium]
MKQIDIENIPEEENKLPDGSSLILSDLESVMHNSMMPYAEYVIMDRALPRVEDGLKPVQRRILYAMYDMGITPDKPYKKSARIVGECLGKYHPHGDTSVYDAMVRLAQPFNTNMPLVDGQGNFGSIDGDPAAAMRYTETKLTPLALELIADIEKDTVSWSRNFDDTTKEPDMLPGRYPNLLVNGATGIAVGLATNIPPHNLGEVIDGVAAYIDNPKITLDKMMKIIKGPDFPTGGHIIAGDGLTLAYETGRGKIYIRAKVHIESFGSDREQIVFTELPYQVNKSRLLQEVLNLRENKKEVFGCISEIVDESDNEGMRGVIKLKKETDAKKVLELLFKYTDLQISFGLNMVAIADGKPQQMGLMKIISYYTKYQERIVTNRTKFLLNEAEERIHILEGLVIAVSNIDEVIKIIKAAANTTEAKQKLRIRFDLSDKQAQAILDLRLARLTKLEIEKLLNEKAELEKKIKEYHEILGSRAVLMRVIKEEMGAIKRQYKRARLSDIADTEEDIQVFSETDERPIENVYFAISYDGTLKNIPLKNFNMSGRDATDRSGFYDIYTQTLSVKTDQKIMIFSDRGNCFQTDVGKIGEAKFHDKGFSLEALFGEKNAEKDERAVKAFVLPDEDMPEGEILIYTRQGMVKRSPWSEYGLLKTAFNGYKCKEDDEVINVEELRPETMTLAVTEKGMCLCFKNDEIPVQGRVASGVKGVNLADFDNVTYMGQIESEGEVIIVTNKCFVKRVIAADIPVTSRYRKGVKIINLTGENGDAVIFADYVTEPYNLALIDPATTFVVNSEDITIETRAHKGKPPKPRKKGCALTDVIKFEN